MRAPSRRVLTATRNGPLPGKVLKGGYVYVVLFSDGTVKVGSSADPASRLAIHRADAACFGITIPDYWVSPWRHGFGAIERFLLGTLERLGATARAGREYFADLDFERAVAAAEDAVEQMAKPFSPQRFGAALMEAQHRRRSQPPSDPEYAATVAHLVPTRAA
jgi:hypothetical protein